MRAFFSWLERTGKLRKNPTTLLASARKSDERHLCIAPRLSLLSRADARMYVATRAGRNRLVGDDQSVTGAVFDSTARRFSSGHGPVA